MHETRLTSIYEMASSLCNVMSNHLSKAFPKLATQLVPVPLAKLPTPLSCARVRLGSLQRTIAIKHDNETGVSYGGNKVRKLEYVLQRANKRHASRLATFGTVASNHAIATALYATQQGFACTCFLSHQSRTPSAAKALRFHLQNDTEIIHYGGNRHQRLRTLRQHLLGRDTWLIPLGGSSWLGSIGFVNAGLELAAQIEAGQIDAPKRVYVALGTMGTAAGLALGFALAGLDIETQGIRVTEKTFANRAGLERLMHKMSYLMNVLDPDVPRDLAQRARVVIRNDFFGDGYARSNAKTEAAVTFAAEQCDIALETTYTGKTMAAVLHDLTAGYDKPVLFWNTYNSQPLSIDEQSAPDLHRLPAEFCRYFDE